MARYHQRAAGVGVAAARIVILAADLAQHAIEQSRAQRTGFCKRQIERFQEFLEVVNLLLARLVVHPIDKRQRLLFKHFGRGDVGEDHELLDQAMRVEPLGHDRAVLGQVVPEVGGDGAVPVDVVVAGTADAGAAVDGAGEGGPGAGGEPPLQVLDDLDGAVAELGGQGALQGKATQQEFCHAFNSLVDAKRQVVVAADVPPSQLDTIDQRMRSRLMGGLVIDIETPDAIQRRKILDLRHMLMVKNDSSAVIQPEVLDLVAERITGGFYLNIEPDRTQLARYGLAVGDLLALLASDVAGQTVRRRKA